ncbi:MAG: hypothetical protein GEV04_20360 [Actinophytocola sp.]|nr:hypothetical protein [Actinophytocola sp.]
MPPEVCVHLHGAGHDAIHMDVFAAEDHRSVVATAAEQGRVVISRDLMLETEVRTSVYPDLSVILLRNLPEDPDTLGRYLCAATHTAHSLLSVGTIAYLHNNGITCTGIRL